MLARLRQARRPVVLAGPGLMTGTGRAALAALEHTSQIPVIGMGGIAMVARSPEFSAIRSVDMLQLIGSGMCLGVSLTWIIRVLRGPSAP